MGKKAPVWGLAPPLRVSVPNERPGHQLPGVRPVTSRNDARDDLCSAWLRPAAGPSCHGPPSPVLRSSLAGRAHGAIQSEKAEPVSVEVGMGSASSRGRPIDQAWMVRLRRGRRSVIVAIGLRRPAADRLAAQVADLLACEH